MRAAVLGIKQFQRGRVGPVNVLVDLEHRPFACKTREQVDQNLERPLPLTLRAKLEARVPVTGRNVY